MPLITIGSHTVSHPRLDKLVPEQAWWELQTAKRQLTDWIGQEVRYFAYPYGYASVKLRHMVQAAGYEAACGIQPKGVVGGTDLFCLPRLHVGDWPGKRLARYLGK